MTDEAKDATLTGASEGEGIDQAAAQAAPVQETPNERELEMERIAAANLARLGVKPEPEPVAAAAAEPAKEEPAQSLSDQLGKQLEDGTLVLDEAVLGRAMVRTKIDGKEELVPAAKALGQYQKGAAADVRLAEATRLARENADLNAKLREQQPTTTAAQQQEAAQDAAKAKETLADLRKQYVEAMYAGDDEKAGQLFDQMTDIRVNAALASREPAAAQVDPNTIVERTVSAVEQQLSVKSALAKLFEDYPEIKADADFVRLADDRRAEFEAQGKSRAEAIALAGDAIGQKFGLGKHKKPDVAANSGLTTREQKLAAKERLDEPTAAAARAVNSSAQLPQSPSQIIQEMAAARGQKAA